jgi:biopolymer transport protein ExbB/TolQ
MNRVLFHALTLAALLAAVSVVLSTAAGPVWAQSSPQEVADAAPPSTLWDMILESGVSGIAFMVVLGIFSFVAVAVILERLVTLTRDKTIPPSFVAEVERASRRRVGSVAALRDLCESRRLTERSLAGLAEDDVPATVAAKLRPLVDKTLTVDAFSTELSRLLSADEMGRYAEAVELHAQRSASTPSPIARVLRSSLVRVGRPVPEVEKAMEDSLAREVLALKSSVRPLSIIGAVAPLVGLLGTVVGMIMAFRTASMEGLGGKAEVLAEGIYLALLTTAAGLTIAIPCLLVAAFFNNRIDRYMREMDEILIGLIPCFARMEKSRIDNRDAAETADENRAIENPAAENSAVAMSRG